MQKVFNAQKLFLTVFILIGFMGTPLKVAQSYDLPAQIDQSALSRKYFQEFSVYTPVNAVVVRDVSSTENAGDPAQAIEYLQEVTQNISFLHLAVTDLPAEGASSQQLGLEGEEKWSVRQPTFPELDTNHDGIISREEAKRWATLDKKFDHVDKDGDHKIDRSELFEFETKQLKESILDFSRGE